MDGVARIRNLMIYFSIQILLSCLTYHCSIVSIDRYHSVIAHHSGHAYVIVSKAQKEMFINANCGYHISLLKDKY